MNTQVNPIPDLTGSFNYFLPPGEHECTFEQIEQKFVYNEKRRVVWSKFKDLIDRITGLGLIPEELLVDGSFVTGRNEPGDVDFVAYIPPYNVNSAIKNATDMHDKKSISIFMDPSEQVQSYIRLITGAHLLIAPHKKTLRSWAYFIERVRDPDPARDPKGLIVPKAKGILKVNYAKLYIQKEGEKNGK